MASPSEEFSKQAYEEAKAGVPQAVADNLREQRGILIASGAISAPPEPDWNALANEAITNRSLNGIPLDEFPPLPDGKKISDLIPNNDRIDLIAQDVAEGVKENTGSIGFLKGATIGQAFRGFFSMIQEKGFGAAISGLFNMIFGDGKSPEATALTQSIAQVTASDISDGVQSRLKSHQAELGLSDQQIAQIGAQTQNSVREKAGLPPVEVPGQNAADPVGPGGMTESQNLSVQNAIRTQVMNNFGLKQQGNELVVDSANTTGAANLNNMAQIAGAPEGKFTGEQKDALVNTMTTALHSVATSTPPITDPAQIKAQIKDALSENADKMGLGNMTPENQDAMITVMANQATAGYLKNRLNRQDRAAGAAFEQSVADENKQLTAQLAESRIRPEVAKGLGIKETAPGQFETVASPDGKPSQIEMLEQIAGGTLSNEQRGAIVGTMSAGFAKAATGEHKDPMAIRDAMKKDLEANADKMGFGDLTPENRNRLFTVMANEATQNYLGTTAGPEAQQQFAAVTGPETKRMKEELTVGTVRQKMFDELAPQTLRGVEDGVIAGVQDQYNNIDSQNIPEPIKGKMKERLEGMLADKDSPEGRAQILSFAAAMGGPNQAQREAMAKESSEAMVGVLTNPENKGKSPEELAPLMEQAVEARLTAKRSEIEGQGGKFRLSNEMIQDAGDMVAKETRKMTPEQQEQIAMGQGMIPAGMSVPNTSLNFDVDRVADYARTMPAVVDQGTAKEVFRKDIRLQTQQQMMNIINQEVDNSIIPGASSGLSINSGYAPNHRQMDFIADQVADVTSDIMADPSIPAHEKGSRAKEAIKARLEEHRDYIDASGKNGGLANDKMNMFVMGLYKYSLTDKHLNMIADGVEQGINDRLSNPNERAQLEQLNALSRPIDIEAPTQTPPQKPGATQIASR